MLFHSWQYFLFFPIILVAYRFLPSKNRPVLLLAASYFFYASWNAAFLSLILLSTLVDYSCALGMGAPGRSNPGKKKALLLLSLFVNIGLLFSFKYLKFATELIGFDSAVFLPDWVLPVGISFYTFQTLSYTIDVYLGRLKPEHNIVHFALYVSFFPQLVAGPIERASALLPQLKNLKLPEMDELRSGITLFLWGLLKKTVVADRISVLADQAFDPQVQVDSTIALIGVLGFGFQILFDFSAYTDMARGSARCLGISLMENFRNPYGAGSVKEFWQRWHISLSTWFRDYVYIPLGGKYGKAWRTIANLMITFVLSGLWHGANLTFVLWGTLHGLLLVTERFVMPKKMLLPKYLGSFFTFTAVMLCWVLFRAENVQHAFSIYVCLFEGNWNLDIAYFVNADNALIKQWITYAFTLVIMGIVLFMERESSSSNRLRNDFLRHNLSIPLLLLLVIFFGVYGSGNFIYFQF